ncbi:MAG: YbgA family protein [Anaerolineae bacterium]
MSKPHLVVSKCLGFDHCRYDGSIISDPIVEALRPWVEFIPVCPEVELGLGAPRPPVRLVRVSGEARLLQPATGRDLTDAMRAFAASFLDALPPVDGFLLKNRSPSCGIKDAKAYAAPEKAPVVEKRPGMFGEAVQARFPDLPIENEGRLTNLTLREHFFTAIFALARLREAVDTGQMRALVDFHTRHKFLLMTYNQTRMRELGRRVANPQRWPVEEVMEAYVTGFRAALTHPPRRPSVINVLMHTLGYVSEGLSHAEKEYFLDLLTKYREGQVSLSAPLSVLRAWVLRFEEPYLSQQTFLAPFPEALLSLQDSGQRNR